MNYFYPLSVWANLSVVPASFFLISAPVSVVIAIVPTTAPPAESAIVNSLKSWLTANQGSSETIVVTNT